MDESKLRKSMSDLSLQISATKGKNEDTAANVNMDLISKVKCECCGLEEECTFSYLNQIKDMYLGSWVCGLCGEAIKERLGKSSTEITLKDALKLHKEFCKEYNESTRTNPKLSLTTSLRDIVKRSSLSRQSSVEKKTLVSKLARSASCVPRIDVDKENEAI